MMDVKAHKHARGGSLMLEQSLFQESSGGANPTSPHQFLKISYKEAHKLVGRFHYLGKNKFIGQYCFGIVDNYDIVGAVVYSPLSVPISAQSAFGLPKGNYPDLLEMSRMVLHPDLNGKNIGSQLIAYSLRQLKKQKIRAVISYADSSKHIGTLYQACNFSYHGISRQKSDFFFEDGTKQSRGKCSGKQGKWVPRTRKHRYLYVFDKDLKVLWPEEPYPKRHA